MSGLAYSADGMFSQFVVLLLLLLGITFHLDWQGAPVVPV